MRGAETRNRSVTEHGVMWSNTRMEPCRMCGLVHPYWVSASSGGMCIPVLFPVSMEAPAGVKVYFPEAGYRVVKMDEDSSAMVELTLF